MIPYKQLSLADIFSDCQEKFENDKPAFLSLLENHIDIDEFIPISFRNHFYASTGRTRKYPLCTLWSAPSQIDLFHQDSSALLQRKNFRPAQRKNLPTMEAEVLLLLHW